ncbi:MAG: hypothetical protein JWR07_3798 [Nevskia sp.]|nr:hypothetical protein [Nevskia sp.]
MKKRKATNRLFKTIHEGAQNLHQAGFIEQRCMREFDALCLNPIRPRAAGNR